MLKVSDTNIEETSAKILNCGHDVAFLVPTQTAMKKSIIDAHDSMRAFLRRNEIHDYAEQKQGVKRKIQAQYVTAVSSIETTISLYRPETKAGDPRIWIYGLNKLAKSHNLLALIYSDKQLYIVNCSNKIDLVRALNKVIPKQNISLSLEATELLQKLKSISGRGFIPTYRKGDTGVGMTLETLLGIAANSSKSPDYKGIELKATRIEQGKRQPHKNQLFSKTPNWKLSPLKSAKDLVLTRGYFDTKGDKALRHTISGGKENSLGLYLDIDYANDYLRQMFTDINQESFNPQHDVTWVLEDLRKALQKKHNETFWVKATHNNDRMNEAFHYVEVEHTANPYVNKLETLFETGLITLDYTLHIKPSGAIRGHGYLFKLKANSINALFPKSTTYDLTI